MLPQLLYSRLLAFGAVVCFKRVWPLRQSVDWIWTESRLLGVYCLACQTKSHWDGRQMADVSRLAKRECQALLSELLRDQPASPAPLKACFVWRLCWRFC